MKNPKYIYPFYLIFSINNYIILQNVSYDGVQELLNIYQQKKNIQDQNNVSDAKKFPLIVLEGLDGCGELVFLYLHP